MGVFQKGQVANPNGGRRPRMVTQQIIASLNETTDDGPTKLRALVDKLIGLALAGDMQAMNAVMDRVEGKPVQMVTGDSEEFRLAVELSDDELTRIARAKSEAQEAPAVNGSGGAVH